MTPKEILDLPLDEYTANESGSITVRGYLVALLRNLWQNGEMFSGKRPLGNSSWEFTLCAVLAKNNIVSGTFDEDGYPEEFDEDQAHQLIAQAIEALGEPQAVV